MFCHANIGILFYKDVTLSLLFLLCQTRIFRSECMHVRICHCSVSLHAYDKCKNLSCGHVGGTFCMECRDGPDYEQLMYLLVCNFLIGLNLDFDT